MTSIDLSGTRVVPETKQSMSAIGMSMQQIASEIGGMCDRVSAITERVKLASDQIYGEAPSSAPSDEVACSAGAHGACMSQLVHLGQRLDDLAGQCDRMCSIGG